MRYTQLSGNDIAEMLKTIGISSVEALFSDIPKTGNDRYSSLSAAGESEIELRKRFSNYAGKNSGILKFTSFLGGGFYEHYIPAIVGTVLSRSEFYTAYTPYQAEAAQGTLQLIFEFQTMMSELTGLPVTNASMYDGATGFAEAVMMSLRLSQGKRKRVLYSAGVNPLYIGVLKNYLQFRTEIELVEVPLQSGITDKSRLGELIDDNTACFANAYPNFFGQIDDHKELCAIVKERGALNICVFYPAAASILKRPGDLDFDMVTGSGQSLGNHMYFSGPAFGFLSAKSEYIRQMPGRLISETADADGKRAFVMTLQTREQHIRREKATSNICSNQTLNTLAANVYLSFLGKNGFRKLGERILLLKDIMLEELGKNGIPVKFDRTRIFNEIVAGVDGQRALEKCLKENIIPGLDLKRFGGEGLLIAVTEMRTPEEIIKLAGLLKGV